MHKGSKLLPVVLLTATAALLAVQAGGQPLAEVNTALQAGEADKALALIRSLPNSASNAEANNLACRVLYTTEHWNEAVDACQRAVNLDKGNSNYHMWLGRALGEKANRASFLSAYSLGKRVRAEFEEAVRLNGRNAEALADLGEFYRAAPGIVGGGLQKADGIAGQLDSVDPARAHELRGRIAESRKDYATAEREFKQSIAASPHPAFRWTSLASYYRRQQRWSDLDTAMQSCIHAAEHDKHAGVPLYDGASLLIEVNRNLPLAAKMLEQYLAGSAQTEEAPAFIAHTRLARVKLKLGDAAGAKREQVAALAMAHDYKPAQNLNTQETRH